MWVAVKPCGRCVRLGVPVLCNTIKDGRHVVHCNDWQYASNSIGEKLLPIIGFHLAINLDFYGKSII